MSKKNESFLWVIGCVITLLVITIPFIYRLTSEPGLTKVELFYKFWYLYVPSFVFLIVAKLRLEHLKRK
jgi:hypothetical protein